MMPTRPIVFLLLGWVFALFTGCRRHEAVASDVDWTPDGRAHLILQTDWFAQAEQGGFYDALLKGYYADEGLEVEILQGGPNAHTLQRVALGDAHFSTHRSDDIILQVSRGMPLLIAGVLMQKDPQALMFHADSGIHGFKDLDGRTIMATPGLNYLEVLRRTFGIDFTVIPHDYGMERFIAEGDFVQQCYITNEPFFVEQAGVKVDTLLIADSGFAPFQVWYTRKDFARRHPDLVRAFNAATIRGWQDYLTTDPTGVHAEILRRNPRTSEALLHYSRAQLIQRQLVTGAHHLPIGTLEPARLRHQIEQLTEIGILTVPVEPEDLYDAAVVSVKSE